MLYHEHMLSEGSNGQRFPVLQSQGLISKAKINKKSEIGSP